MLNQLHRWLSGGSRHATELAALARWAQAAGHDFKPVRDGAGGVVESSRGAIAWRAEWGESQRAYIPGTELRLIAEPDLPKDLNVLVINRELAESLERAMFEQAVDDVQTRIDDNVPPEVRWLVMYPKLDPGELGKLRLRYVALGNAPILIAQWLASPLGEALAQTLPRVASTEPVALSVGRGRLVCRTSMAMPDGDRLSMWQDVFVTALGQIGPIVQAWRDADRRPRPGSWPASEAPPTSDPADDQTIV